MSTIKKAELRKTLHQEVIGSEKLYYSFVEKSQQTLSMMKNQRFLIFNQTKGQLFYVNDPKTVPFVTTIPKPKNNIFADLNLTTTLKSTGANEFNIQFTFINKENKPQTGEWNFITENKQLTAAWVKLLAEYFEMKKRRAEQQVRNNKQVKKEVTSFNYNRRGSGYNYSRVEEIGYDEERKYQEVKPVLYEQRPKSIYDSKTKPITPPPPTITISQPPTKPQPLQPNLPINNTPIIKETPPILNTNPSRGSLYNSQQNNHYQQLSPQKKSQVQQSNKNSRLTFKDEIQSMIDKNSRVSIESNQGASNIRQTTTLTKQAYRRDRDWNWRFYNTPTQQVIYQYQQYSTDCFLSILKQDRLSNQPLRVYLQPQSIVIVTDFGSVEAKKIKSQFRNYHFIMEAVKGERFGNLIGVPLTCLIQYQGLVVMVKSLIPEHAPKVQCTYQLMLQIKDIQRYTRVKNNILKKSTLYDLSNIYQTAGKRLLYINQLIEYLPAHMDELFYGSLLRPEHMLDNVDQFMHGGLGYEAMRQDVKMFEQTVQLVRKNTIQLAKEISCGDVKFTNGEELKNILHQRGINLKYLPLLYNETTNKQIKKHVHSFMVAKIAKQDILSNIVSTRPDRMKSTKPQLHIKQLVQQSIKLLIQGNSNVSSQLWKDLSLSFKRQYGFQISTSDIHGPFLLNTLMRLLKIDYDLGRINMKKVMFKDDRIIDNGFVIGMGMKVKSYYRWMTRDIESLMHVCKLPRRDVVEFMGVCELLELKKKSMPKYLQLVRITPYLQQYLTSFIPPPQFQAHQFKHLTLYTSISSQPPTTHSLTITLSYLKWCLQYNRISEFKMAMDQALQLIDIWLGQQGQQKGSFQHCQFYELLSEFYYKQGNVDDSVNFLKQSLATMIRNNGLGSKRIADGYYMLGEREMKLGRWPQALENFIKAKQSMQASKSTQHINYPKSLLKLSQLYLQSTQFQPALVCAKQAIQQFQKQQSLSQPHTTQKQSYDQYCIKAIQVMCRVFQIQGKKNELHRIAQMTAAKYNKTKSTLVYEQVVKMSLISIINRTSLEKCRLFINLIEKVITAQNNNRQYKDDTQRIKTSLQELMQMSAQYNVMQRFMFKFDSLERMVLDINGKRSIGTDTKQFIAMLRPIVDLVGEEFIIGLVEQREMEQ